MRHFDTRKDGQVSYNEFCDALPLVPDVERPFLDYCRGLNDSQYYGPRFPMLLDNHIPQIDLKMILVVL